MQQHEFIAILRHSAAARQRISRQLTVHHRHARYWVLARRGFILIATYLGVAVMSTMSLAYFNRTSTDHQMADRHVNHARALHYAEAGLDQTIRELATDPDYAGTGAIAAVGDGACLITVSTDDDDTELRRVEVTGYYPGPAVGSNATQQDVVHAMLRVQIGKYNFPMFAYDHIEGGGTVGTDAYDGAAGYYGEVVEGEANSGLPGADIGTNGTATTNPEAIGISGSNVTIGASGQDDVYIGPNGDTAAAIDLHPGANYDERKTLTQEVEVIAYSVPAELSDGYTPTALNMSGGTITLDRNYPNVELLADGTYGIRFTLVSLTGNAVVQVADDKVKAYVDGPITVKGNNVTVGDVVGGVGEDSTKLEMHGNEDVDYGGGATFCGVINAPNGEITLSGNSATYGAMLANTINLGGTSNFYFDKQLDITNGEDIALVELVAYYNENQETAEAAVGGGGGVSSVEVGGGGLPLLP